MDRDWCSCVVSVLQEEVESCMVFVTSVRNERSSPTVAFAVTGFVKTVEPGGGAGSLRRQNKYSGEGFAVTVADQ